MKWYFGPLKKYAVFRGRARRKEFWTFYLWNAIIFFLLGGVEGVSGLTSRVPSVLYTLLVALPIWAVGVRRLHDTGRSGWWWLIALVPIIGLIVLLVFMAKESQVGDNRFGRNLERCGSLPVESNDGAYERRETRITHVIRQSDSNRQFNVVSVPPGYKDGDFLPPVSGTWHNTAEEALRETDKVAKNQPDSN
jgi:uncharacterized membrane protein YhaH (DUF805 family)